MTVTKLGVYVLREAGQQGMKRLCRKKKAEMKEHVTRKKGFEGLATRLPVDI